MLINSLGCENSNELRPGATHVQMVKKVEALKEEIWNFSAFRKFY